MAAYLIAAALLLLTLTGCGVRLEVSTPPIPTPTPRVFPGVDYSRNGIWRVQATPRIIFPVSENAQMQLFMQEQLPVLLLAGRQLYVGAEYDATWFSNAQSNAQVRLRAYTRGSDDDEWLPYDSSERDLTTSSAPATSRDSLSLMLTYAEPTAVQVRIEVSVIAYNADGSITTNVETNDFPLLVLQDSSEIEVDLDALVPQYGEWGENQMLFDWRDWHGGPCGLTDREIAALDAACEAWENGDGDQLYTQLRAALEQADDPELRGIIAGQIGLLLVLAGDVDQAAETFSQSVEAYTQSLLPFQVGVHLHNLAAAQIMREDGEATAYTLQVLQELRGQFYDEAGNMFTQAIAGYWSDEPWRLDEPMYWFRERDLPQGDIVEIWKTRAEQ
ncbi:MAG: hypothetical protein IPK17_28355 [Chloroflexi bacterium]|uniref:hypothetical protein n=1 Tax=Candidatus Flexifilum breve TaxID=3140694 RepID=UPI00313512D5|nr:hypothetical protein [Chloroflexota bacterium]